MTRESKTATRGDIYRYTPPTYWCRHGILIVNENGTANDTYWGSGEPGRYSAAEILTLKDLRHIGNLADFRKVAEFVYEQYMNADRLWIPMGGGSERYYVRVAAKPDVKLQIQQQEAIIARSESDINSATWRIERAKAEIEKLKAGYL